MSTVQRVISQHRNFCLREKKKHKTTLLMEKQVSAFFLPLPSQYKLKQISFPLLVRRRLYILASALHQNKKPQRVKKKKKSQRSLVYSHTCGVVWVLANPQLREWKMKPSLPQVFLCSCQWETPPGTSPAQIKQLVSTPVAENLSNSLYHPEPCFCTQNCSF